MQISQCKKGRRLDIRERSNIRIWRLVFSGQLEASKKHHPEVEGLHVYNSKYYMVPYGVQLSVLLNNRNDD